MLRAPAAFFADQGSATAGYLVLEFWRGAEHAGSCKLRYVDIKQAAASIQVVRCMVE